MIIVPGAYSETLALKLAELLKCEVLNVERKLFPDGESYVRFSDPSKVKGEDVIIVQTTYPEQDKRLMELFLMLDAAKDFNAKNVIAVVPYLAYARQDKRFREGECLSIK
ncbi:MAG: ribose-phosphate pyrophosphokinase, partial [Candidatus Methanomethylicota archaeon]